MVTDREAWIADRIRKLLTVVLAAAGTWLLLRVLYRAASGAGRLSDPELYAFLGIVLVAVVWIRAARRAPRRPASRAERDDGGDAGGPPGGA